MTRNGSMTIDPPGPNCRGRRRCKSARGGFTLVEVLIVVVILSVLALMVVPQMSTAASTARQSTLRENLRYLRTQIMVYQAQHNGLAPGYPGGDATAAATEQAFLNQMTLYTSVSGAVSAEADGVHRYGPYLQRVPINPFNGRSDVRIVSDSEPFPSGPVGSEGWVYQAATGTIAANVDDVDSSGTPYFTY